MAQDTSFNNNTKSLDDYILLGRSGLRVSPFCLGTLGVGVNKEESKKVFDLYYEKSDTACNYNFGESERFLGDYVSDKRSDVVIATKYTSSTTAMQRIRDSTQIMSLVENLNGSLKRLNISYVDILYVHFYEYRTPIEEFMRSLDDVVRSGKVLYVAVSDIPSWGLARANTMSELRGWSSFIGLQTRYNLLDRSLEFDLQPACAELDVGIIPWGVIAEGFLTGKYTRESVAELNPEPRSQSVARHSKIEKNWKILDEVIAISKEIGRTPVQVAMNWVQQKPGITSPLIGAKTVTQLEESLKTLEFKLTPEQMKRLDEVSKPTEIPFPYSYVWIFDKYLGKNIEVPNKFEPVASTYNFGRLQ
ncbi:aldo/keto reductase [Rhizophagus clarus]|uniref:Aldo/keto reductase n=1 Tax=Rhizophagus clarus TaxID=94130 RepID=A0A8H3M7S6_9GLOM|nr:aldo/keto reductase [Rhizophagus clarus]